MIFEYSITFYFASIILENEVDGETLFGLTDAMTSKLIGKIKQQVIFMKALEKLKAETNK